MFWSIVTASTLLPAVAPTSAAALLTVISCVRAARPSTSFCDEGGRVPTRTFADAGLKPSYRARSSYWPGATRSKRNAPASSAAVVCTTVPAAFTSSTVAAASTAPV